MNEHPVILFDGFCNFCNAAVNFVLKQDRKGVFRFAALQSEAGQKLSEQYNLPEENFKSFVLIENGKVFQKSTAALKVLKHLPWYWKEMQLLKVVPTFLRDAIYDFVAKNRYKWFGKKQECMIPTATMKARFLSE